MAGTVTHLAVADKIIASVGKDKFSSPALFFCGNLAPDAIHAREGFVRPMKKHTHLTDGLHGRDFLVPEKRALFRERLREFALCNYCPGEENSDLYLGYVTHLICDEYFNIHIRRHAASLGISEDDKDEFFSLVHDVNVVDKRLTKVYPFVCDVLGMIKSEWGYEICKMITADEITRSKKWVISSCFENFKDEEVLLYSVETALSFISDTADKIIGRLHSLSIF